MAILEAPFEPFGTPGLQVISGNSIKRRSEDRGIVHAKSQDGLLTWTYSTSLFAGFDHPEILVAGLDPFLANSVMEHVLELISHGRVYSDGSSSESALHQLICVFRRMAPSAASKLMPTLANHPALQLVYPDHKNRLPWQPGHNPSWRDVQPLFLADGQFGDVECNFLDAVMHRPLLADRRRHE